MATFPSYVEILFAGYSERFDPSVERVEMERGSPKESIINSRVMQQIKASLLFRSAADVQAFEDWYFTDIKRIGYFDLEHPRLGGIVQAKFPGGDIGELVPLNTLFRVARRDVVLEYMR